jgi:hypothetical protein
MSLTSSHLCLKLFYQQAEVARGDAARARGGQVSVPHCGEQF